MAEPGRAGAVSDGAEDHRPRWTAVARSGVTHAVLLGAASVAVYSNTLDVPLVFDDLAAIVENPAVKSLEAFAASGSWWTPRFLALATFAIDGSIHGGRLAGFHVANLAVHAAAVLLVYALGRTLLSAPRFASSWLAPNASLVSLAAAALFAVHPLQTQAVTYVVQRTASLAAAFYLASAVCYLRWRLDRARLRRWGWFAAALLAAVAAVFTKQNTLTLPLVLSLLEAGFVEDRLRVRVAAVAPFFAVVAVALPWLDPRDTIALVAAEAAGRGVGSWLAYALTQCRVLAIYLGMLLVPVGQSIDHALPASASALEPGVLAGGALLAALGGAGLWLFARPGRQDVAWRLVGLGVLWWFVAHGVESTVFPIADVMVEHRVYLPSVGIFLSFAALAAIAQRAIAGRAPSLRAAPPFLVGAAVLLLAGGAHARNEVWRDEVALWRQASERSPWNARAFNNLGAALLRAQRPAEAIAAHEAAIRLRPAYATAYWGLSKAQRAAGRIDRAEASLATARRLAVEEQVALARTLMESGDWRPAVVELTNAVAGAPLDGQLRRMLGVASLEAGDLVAACRELRLATLLAPDDVGAWLDYARALELRGDRAGSDRALAEARRAGAGAPAGGE